REQEPDRRREAAVLAQWLLPIVKTAGAQIGFSVASLGVQVLGGAGYTREWPIEQGLRDARVLSVFEGASGIQALDLLHRRLLRGDGEALNIFLARAKADVAQGEEGEGLREALDALEAAGAALRAGAPSDAEAGASAFLDLAILCAQGWIAARLAALP